MAMNKNRGLGRGLSALFSELEAEGDAQVASYTPEERAAAEEGHDLTEVDVELIRPNPNQPRKHFDENALNELAASISKHGMIMPIVVTAQPGGTYMIIAGERRYRAAYLHKNSSAFVFLIICFNLKIDKGKEIRRINL